MADDLAISLKVDVTSAQLGYFPPSWSSKPKKRYSIDVWKEGTILVNIPLSEKEYYVIGRNKEVCDITLANPTVSRVHCVLQHRDNGCVYLYDLKTAYGTFVNRNKIEPQSYVKLSRGETFKIANSTKMFILNCVGEEEDDEAKELQASSAQNQNTLQLLMKPNKDNIRLDKESNWGIEDNDDEIIQYQLNEDNIDDNDLNINELLHKDSLTSKQKELVQKITKLLTERDHILKEKESLKYADYDNEDTDAKKKLERKKYYFTKRQGEISELLERLKGKLSESLKATEENSLRFNRKLYKESNDNDDEFYDRTKADKKAEESTEVINYESMKASLESLIKEKQKYTDMLSHADPKPIKRKEEIDSIDQYFIDNEKESQTENIKDKLDSIENAIRRTEQLLDYVTPLHLKIKRNAEGPGTANQSTKGNFIPPIAPSTSAKVSKAQSNRKKESIAEVMNKMNRLQSTSVPMNSSEGIVSFDNEGVDMKEDEVQLDDEMIIKLNEYKQLLSNQDDKDKRRKDKDNPLTKKKEANLFQEIVANIGNTNFEVSNYPQIASRYESRKDHREKKDSKPIEDIIPEEEEPLIEFQGKKRQRDAMKPSNNPQHSSNDPAEQEDNEEAVKGKWIEETISDNPFNKYLNNNDN